MRRFDLSTPSGRLRAYLDFLWTDHAWIRFGFQNAHWISEELVRTNQPWPYQLRWWKAHGVKTVLNLRGEFVKSHHVIEADACARLGLTMVDLVVKSREAPTLQQVLDARSAFETIAYPCLMHCKSGADRAGLMSVLYAHFRLGQPIRQAVGQLSLRYGHFRQGYTGVLDHFFQEYLADGEPNGLSLIDWMSRPEYDHHALKAQFRSNFWGRLITERLLRRE